MTSYLALTLLTAVAFGMRHATDADHVLAVSTIVSREPTLARARGIGVLWGAGHTATILAVGGALILFGSVMPHRVAAAFETAVALMLIALGARNVMSHGAADRPAALPPFLIGVVHGLAGSAAATLLIVPLIRDRAWAVLYLAVFGLGTIAGMVLLTSVIAASARLATRRVAGLQRWVATTAGALSLSFGAFLLYRMV